MLDEVTITSWGDLRDRLESFDSTAMFRGQSDASWKLVTSIERRCAKAERRADYETYLQHVFESSAPRLGVGPEFVDKAHGPS
jgi:hypothetical protein